MRKKTFSKPVFGVSKPSISGFVAVGPHCIYVYICSPKIARHEKQPAASRFVNWTLLGKNTKPSDLSSKISTEFRCQLLGLRGSLPFFIRKYPLVNDHIAVIKISPGPSLIGKYIDSFRVHFPASYVSLPECISSSILEYFEKYKIWTKSRQKCHL